MEILTDISITYQLRTIFDNLTTIKTSKLTALITTNYLFYLNYLNQLIGLIWQLWIIEGVRIRAEVAFVIHIF